MWDKIDSIEWKSKEFPDAYSSHIPTLFRGLLHESYNFRVGCMFDLSGQIKQAYEDADNTLPFLLIPIFIDMLTLKEIKDRSVITGLLLELATLSRPWLVEPHKSIARHLKIEVCKHSGLFEQFLSDDIAKADFTALVSLCSE